MLHLLQHLPSLGWQCHTWLSDRRGAWLRKRHRSNTAPCGERGVATCLRPGLVWISYCACRRWTLHRSQRRRHPSQGAVGTRAPGVSRRGRPSSAPVSGAAGERRLSHAGRHAVTCPSSMPVSPARRPPDGPCPLLRWLGDRKENSALLLSLGNLLSGFSPSKRKKIHRHTDFLWSKCIYNSSNNPQGYPDWVCATTRLRFILPF